MPDAQRFVVQKPMLDDELDLLLAYPTLEAAWWESFREAFNESVEEAGIQPIGDWFWYVIPPSKLGQGRSLIVGEVTAIPRLE